ncbi:mechanosensitive ion channel [Terrimonas sp. NA20]|uniref:Mechanosensitive ion channel n=1 Tax=Terrimonas ginsenosidimutans TaxID=2908004 RepID=A0ABS9KYG2_9BACT|nr:mechanosensitive ion channel domain-containing protein [Terrimonas ginsenosidimutans]MCG2617348.1 mechanosensitive ion channel [Terrimonas ginsenosidimutans]
MQKPTLPLVFVSILLLASVLSTAQDSLRFKRDTTLRNDTSRRDTTRFRRGMNSLFADSSKLTSSDYQLRIEKTYDVLSMIRNQSDLGPGIAAIREKLADSDSSLFVLKDNIVNNSSALSLRNLQMFRTLLANIHEDIEHQRMVLDSAEAGLSGLRTEMKNLIADTVLRELWRDSANRQLFAAQLKDMREAWRTSTTKLKESIALINQLQTHNSGNAITTASLEEKVNNLLLNSFARVFGKEFNYLWEPTPDSSLNKLRSAYERAYTGERKALRYYFKDSVNTRLFLLLIGLLFGIWAYRNILRLKKANAVDILKGPQVDYLYPHYIASVFLAMFSLAPLFDLDAPSVYIESMQFLLILTLTFICWKKWPRKLFVYWIVMVFLYLCFSFTHHLLVPGVLQRSWLILLNVLSVIFGSLFLRGMKDHLHFRGFLRFVIILHNVMNVLAVVCNLFGRFSLAQILGSAAIFSFTQAIGLAVFSRVIIEAILLQIEASRIRQGVKNAFDYQAVLQAFKGPIAFLVFVLWLIVFTTNLNIYETSKEVFVFIMQKQRSVGSATFTIGGVLLFFLIIWVAHLLQKYVGYFFGDTGSEEIENKRQRSKMLIARLVVLCLGYLLAVAASGLPVDKITIVLGALGVGIGLGLQNIVSNFVSGIILIFDRPLQVGDAIEIGDKAGKVREIGLRSSTLLTTDGAEVIIPNGDILSTPITNWTLTNNQQRLALSLSVSGSNDIEKVNKLVTDTIISSGYVMENVAPQIEYISIKKEQFDLKVYFWCKDVFKASQARSAIIYLLHKQLAREDISIEA